MGEDTSTIQVGAEPALHRWLSEVLGETPQQAAAVRELLAFPCNHSALRPAAALTEHRQSLKRHLEAALVLTDLLALDHGQDERSLRRAVCNGATHFDELR